MSASERRALLMLLVLAIAGHAVRRLATRPGEPPGQVQLLATLAPGSPTAHRDSAVQLARPLKPGERIDADKASAQELARLPRVGMALAKTIVADREEHGPFGGLEGLDRVPGVGPGLLKSVAEHLTFSGQPRALASSASHAVDAGAAAATITVSSFASRPRVSHRAFVSGTGSGQIVNINSASKKELETLPGIGPSRAKAIIEYRERHGPFPSTDALTKVPGIGPAALARLQGRITV